MIPSLHYVTFYPAVMFATIYGGFAAGVLSTILSGCVISLMILSPIDPSGLTSMD